MASVLKKCECDSPKCGHPWTVRYREPGGRDGRKREKSFRLKKEADAFAVKVESDKNEGLYFDPERGNLPVRVWAADWLSRHVINEGTRRNYQGFIDNHLIPSMGGKTILGVTSADVKKLQAEMSKTLAASTVNDRLNCLRAMMRAAVQEKRIPESPCAAVKPLKVAVPAVDPDEIPTLAEVNAIAAAMSSQYRLSVWLMAGAGLRISEALGFSSECKRGGFLRLRRQISAKANQEGCRTRLVPLKHRTADEYRDVPMPLFLADEIDHHLSIWGSVLVEGLEVLFAPRERGKGSMPTASTFGYHWKKALKAAGLELSGYTPHSLRHFFASTALANGVPIHEVSRWLGHRSIKTTVDTYGHLVPEAWGRCRDVMQNAMRPTLTLVQGGAETAPQADVEAA
ncbi:tyrosine-type recombinase/integrase [Kitasatospora sp. NBC_00070]|uniref:tyrosine-type recombinase/integrase n=1 Tax=Kitasatospora sp. NBC_00070 TaxID=2975962 RepID=UPI00324EDDCC